MSSSKILDTVTVKVAEEESDLIFPRAPADSQKQGSSHYCVLCDSLKWLLLLQRWLVHVRRYGQLQLLKVKLSKWVCGGQSIKVLA